MKLEKPPVSEFKLEYFTRIRGGEFDDFIQKSDIEYYYWDDIKYKKGLPFESALENWNLLKLYRQSKYESLTFGKYKFHYFLSNYIAQSLHNFDLKLMGSLQKSPLSGFDSANFLLGSLFEEAIASSQVEGAATTTEVAREMLKKDRQPKNESEQMIVNNLRAIQYIKEVQDKELDFQIIVELHRIMTVKTSAEKYAGSFRKGEVFITDHVEGEIAHIPPDWEEVEVLMSELCKFINEERVFIHPILKASMIHFMIGFIHPFQDGNGRTARALFYWFLLKKGYSFIEHISISKAILETRTQYDKAFLKTEYDDNDLNYFLTYSLKTIRIAFAKLLGYRDKKLSEQKNAQSIAFQLLEKGLNKRQASALGYLYLKEQKQITIQDFQEKNKITRQTASKDLQALIKLGLLLESKNSKPYGYRLSSRKKLEDFLNGF